LIDTTQPTGQQGGRTGLAIKREPKEMPTLQRPDGAELNYELWGLRAAHASDVEPQRRVIFLSPSNTSLNELRPYLSGQNGVTKIDKRFTCLAFDHRGTGESSKPSASWPEPSVAVYAQDAFALLEEVGWTSAHVVGFSFGGAVAQEMLLDSSAGFRALRVLMVCAATDIGAKSGSYPLHDLLSLSRDERAEKMLMMADSRRDEAWLESDFGKGIVWYMTNMEDEQRKTPGGFEGRAWQMRARKTHKTLARLRAAYGVPDPDEPAATTANDPAHGTPAAAASSPAPLCDAVGIFASVYDRISPPCAARRLRDAMQAPGIVWVPTGHWPNLARERSTHFERATLNFLLGSAIPKDVLDASAVAEQEIVEDDNSNETECVIL
jgi:pimeloyl-ACP methyl ester carboxylesterase